MAYFILWGPVRFLIIAYCKMSYRLKFDDKNKIIMGKIIGKMDAGLVKNMVTEVSRLLDEFNCNLVLNDLREAELTGSTFDIYQMPRLEFDTGINFNTKRALLVNEITNDFRFLETASVNFGHQVKIFIDYDKAISWLKEDP